MKIMWEEDSQREHKRHELVKSAAQLFFQKGFKNTKLDEIASAGLNGKTSLYYYFSNKGSLFKAVIEWEVSKIYREIESYTLAGESLTDFTKNEFAAAAKAAAANFDSMAALQRYAEVIVDIGDKLLRPRKGILKEYHSFQKLLQSIIKAFKEHNVLLLRAILQRGMQNGQLGLTANDVDLAAYAIFRLCLTYFSDIMQGVDFQISAVELKKIVLLIAAK